MKVLLVSELSLYSTLKNHQQMQGNKKIMEIIYGGLNVSVNDPAKQQAIKKVLLGAPNGTPASEQVEAKKKSYYIPKTQRNLHKQWTEEEDKYVLAQYRKQPYRVTAKQLGRTEQAISIRMSKLRKSPEQTGFFGDLSNTDSQ